jgi:hypothetical protein
MTLQHNHDWPLVFTISSLLITCLNIYNFIAPIYLGFLMRLGENYTRSAYIGYIVIHTICCLNNKYTDWIFILLIYLFHLHIFKRFNETNQQFCEYEKMHMVEKHIIILWVHVQVYSMRQTNGFHRILWFPSPINLNVTIQLKYCLKCL